MVRVIRRHPGTGRQCVGQAGRRRNEVPAGEGELGGDECVTGGEPPGRRSYGRRGPSGRGRGYRRRPASGSITAHALSVSSPRPSRHRGPSTRTRSPVELAGAHTGQKRAPHRFGKVQARTVRRLRVSDQDTPAGVAHLYAFAAERAARALAPPSRRILMLRAHVPTPKSGQRARLTCRRTAKIVDHMSEGNSWRPNRWYPHRQSSGRGTGRSR